MLSCRSRAWWQGWVRSQWHAGTQALTPHLTKTLSLLPEPPWGVEANSCFQVRRLTQVPRNPDAASPENKLTSFTSATWLSARSTLPPPLPPRSQPWAPAWVGWSLGTPTHPAHPPEPETQGPGSWVAGFTWCHFFFLPCFLRIYVKWTYEGEGWGKENAAH